MKILKFDTIDDFYAANDLIHQTLKDRDDYKSQRYANPYQLEDGSFFIEILPIFESELTNLAKTNNWTIAEI